MAKGYGFFEFKPEPAPSLPQLLSALLAKAKDTVGPVDGVLLPELAMTDKDFDSCAQAVLAEAKFSLVV